MKRRLWSMTTIVTPLRLTVSIVSRIPLASSAENSGDGLVKASHNK